MSSRRELTSTHAASTYELYRTQTMLSGALIIASSRKAYFLQLHQYRYGREQQASRKSWERLGLSKVIYEEAPTRASDHSILTAMLDNLLLHTVTQRSREDLAFRFRSCDNPTRSDAWQVQGRRGGRIWTPE